MRLAAPLLLALCAASAQAAVTAEGDRPWAFISSGTWSLVGMELDAAVLTTVAGPNVRFSPVKLRESQQLRLQRLYPKTVVKTALNTILVPRPSTARP